MTASSATEALTQFVTTADVDRALETLPPRLRGLFLDHLGIAAFAAVRADSSPAVRAAVDRLDPAGGDSIVVGADRRYSLPYAAFLNGVHAHSLDMDDTNRAQTAPVPRYFPSRSPKPNGSMWTATRSSTRSPPATRCAAGPGRR